MPRDARGRFLPGPDADRHQLTHEERSRGYAAMLAKPMSSRLRAALRKKIRRDLAGKPNHAALARKADHDSIRAILDRCNKREAAG